MQRLIRSDSHIYCFRDKLSTNPDQRCPVGRGSKARQGQGSLNISYSSTGPSSIHRSGHLLRVVDVVDQLLDDGGGVGGLDALAVVGDDGAGRSADDDGALLALFGISIHPFFRGVYCIAAITFLPYRLRGSALIVRNFSEPTEKPLVKALSGEVKAAARVLMSSCESYMCEKSGLAGDRRSPRITPGAIETYRETGRLGLETREIGGEDPDFVELARAHQAGVAESVSDDWGHVKCRRESYLPST